MNELFIELEHLLPNPYQPRQHEDPAVVQELAENIERNATDDFDGLLQAPTVRAIGEGHYQLAFGHTRKAAFAYLFNQGKSRYGRMRAYVRELTDVQMFEAAVAENIKRRDLNPIEQAESMRRYMDEFHKTSVEAGEFFNCSEENVRAKVRLLNLPAPVQEKMRAGEVNENAARSLLTLTRMLPNNEEVLAETVKEISDGEKPEEAVELALRGHPNTKIIGDESDGHFSMKAKTFKYLPKITWQYAHQILDINSESVIWEGAIEQLYKGNKKTHQEYFSEPDNIEPDALGKLDKLAHLIKPPACTACPMFAVLDGTGYCAWAACFDRKKEAHEEAELHRVSEAVGIAVYSKEDGSAVELHRWGDRDQNAFKKKHADLRLRRSNSYNTWEGIPNYFAVVAVGNLFQTWKKADEKTKAFNDAHNNNNTSKADYERERAIRQIRDAQLSLFAWNIAAPVFATLLDGIKVVDVLSRIDDEMSSGILDSFDEMMINGGKLKKMSKPAALAHLRKSIVYAMLGNRMNWNDENKIRSSKTPVATFAKHVQGLATTWGVKLPKDFLEKASEHDEAVKLAIAELDKQGKDGDE